MLVVDAGALVMALASDEPDGDLARSRLRGERLAAPHLVDLEVASALRGLTSAGKLDPRRATLALDDLIALPLERAPHAPLLPRCWQLRANLTTYDASYVALAEALTATLVTTDARLARASGIRCDVEVLAAS